ncbi:MAG TPA: CRISPR-associated protein Cas5 [Paenibacillus sp.]|uniref:CRISPR-associated protein Cas5 n=1 Tax=Paenibacillus sp. TaxID=58172 RepID=UPI002BB7E1C5|nr:CRISPR-associated protein Cas5 [Paenibacillus sp.]HUC93257.1 CRISPR-associated protein Cas5 [Paenibacillus sp.]
MIALYIESPYGEFRKSYARSFAESYVLPPPSTVYGMLLSAVGERFRSAHEGVRLAFAFRRMPRVATTLRKMSRLKYGVASKQATLGNAPEYIETLCNVEMICWVDSSGEKAEISLERRLMEAIGHPDSVERYGLVSLGLSDDLVNELSLLTYREDAWYRLVSDSAGQPANSGRLGDEGGAWSLWYRLIPDSQGSLELPVWVDHLGSAGTRRQRFELDASPTSVEKGPGTAEWPWITI